MTKGKSKLCKNEGCNEIAKGRHQYCKLHSTDECIKARHNQSCRKGKEGRLGYYIYRLKNKSGQSIYVGSCCDCSNRVRKHLTGNSNIQIPLRQWITLSEYPSERGYGLSYVEVAEVSNFVNSEVE
ncbi:GIY-YIG nuclease family protein [Clostridium estertheticum]|uniref:GIY-YIG nuclease family protein n=1 Tax=Clostridium estertheticum TaxID=238834 RepID=UPI001C7D25CE|nr:GIY-YIG nuclease family protein [Clostridium estertheticum]MBX4258835.1 GIY-YIG nuclease family protein [Clostridium estertheticum]WLC69159.1 GIY-YIG nuclease family protein [Clostridium estertheticum]